MGTIVAGKLCSLAAWANQDPFSAKAYWPVRKRSQEADWLSVMADFGVYPLPIQSETSWPASTAASEPGSLRSAPAPQNHGRNWNVPSSPEMPAKVMPLL